MFITFYDKTFKALQNNASLNVSDWNLTRHAVDYDDFTATSEAFIENVNPTFVIMSDDRGRYKYGAFAGIPQIDKNNQTKLQASDLKTIFNNEMVASFDTYTYLKDYFDALFVKFASQVIQQSISFEIIYDDSLATKKMGGYIPPTEMAKYNVWEDLIAPYLKYYDLYIESKINLSTKKLQFYIHKIDLYERPLKIWEINAKNFGKNAVAVNETDIYTYIKESNSLYHNATYVLKADNSITTTTSYRDLFPIKRKCFFQEMSSLEETNEIVAKLRIDALKELVNSRYQESLELSTQNDPTLNEVDFNYSFNIYVEKGKLYKKLPVGTIIESNKTAKKFIIGYKPESIVFYFK